MVICSLIILTVTQCMFILQVSVPFDIVPQEVMEPCIEETLLHPGTAGKK